MAKLYREIATSQIISTLLVLLLNNIVNKTGFEIWAAEQSQRSQDGPCRCGVKQEIPSPRIVGGAAVQQDEFVPWRCSILFRRASGFNAGENFAAVCSCTIISKRWILTAAHCTDPADFPGLKPFVLAGVNTMTPTDESMDNLIRVKTIVNHPEYDNFTKLNDLSLLELSRDLSFEDSNRTAPICLPYKFRREKFYHQSVMASGYGATNPRNVNSSTVLRKVQLPVLTTAQCRRLFRGTGINITTEMICTSTLQRRDTCFGDSGGSIDYRDEDTGQYHAIGVVSFGLGCASRFPGVYVKLTKYLRYIERTTGESFCKA